MTSAGLPVGCRYQLVQDAALADGVIRVALGPQRAQLSFKRAHAREARPHTRKLRLNQGVHVGTIGFGSRHELEQALDVCERHVQRPAMADERQTLEMSCTIGAIAVRLPSRWRQEASLFVIADGLDIDPGVSRQFPDTHAIAPSCFVDSIPLDAIVAIGFLLLASNSFMRSTTVSDCCSAGCTPQGGTISPRFRRALWTALGINAAMFLVEIAGGLKSGSVSLLADAIDFAGDAANYGLTLAVLSLGLAWRARAALVKGLTMGTYGILVLAKTAWAAAYGVPPEPVTMGAIALIALAANVGVAAMLYAWRDGDSNMRSVWLCSRNDAIGNLAVLMAAAGVLGTGTAWPDLIVAGVIATLALSAAASVIRHARAELASTANGGPHATVT